MVREAILADKSRKKSDRELAKKGNFSKGLVGLVRRQMIAAGELPLNQKHKNARPGDYTPGQSARGGYVYDKSGNVITVSQWEQRLTATKTLAEVLREAKKRTTLSWVKIGKVAGITRGGIAKILNGDTQEPSAATIIGLLRAMGQPVTLLDQWALDRR